jgi:hypothetical protein
MEEKSVRATSAFAEDILGGSVWVLGVRKGNLAERWWLMMTVEMFEGRNWRIGATWGCMYGKELPRWSTSHISPL